MSRLDVLGKIIYYTNSQGVNRAGDSFLGAALPVTMPIRASFMARACVHAKQQHVGAVVLLWSAYKHGGGAHTAETQKGRTGDKGVEALRELGLQLVDGARGALAVARAVLHKARGHRRARQPLPPLRQGAACMRIRRRAPRVQRGVETAARCSISSFRGMHAGCLVELVTAYE